MQAGTRVRIPWKRANIIDWNEACAWAMEQYGLPGDKFTTHATADYIDFYFDNERDAILFELTWG